NENANRLSNGFPLRVTEYTLRSSIPTGNCPVESLRNDCIFRRFDNRGKQEPRLVHKFAFRDIADCACDQKALLGLNWTHPDLRGKLTSSFAQAEQFQVRSHGPNTRRSDKIHSVPAMSLAETRRQEYFHIASNHLFSLIPKYPFRLGVNDYDLARFIYYNHCV